MATYEEIKAAAVRVRNEEMSSDATRHLAEIAMALCDRVAELEARHQADVHRLENWLKNMRL